MSDTALTGVGVGVLAGLLYVFGLTAGIMWERYGRFRWELLAVSASSASVLVTVMVAWR